jgi:DNA-binding NarL/FixJ family response regulator
MKGGIALSFRVLVVEDYEPYRRFVVSTLQTSPELQVICQVSDGLEAVQKAQELKPDLIVLDIGLPRLNGIEAARRIRKLSPESKILFLSQESSADMVQEALSIGASGYVVKAHAARDLLAAAESVLRGKKFLSSSLRSNDFLKSPTQTTEAADRHAVQFYDDDRSLVDGFVRFIEPALRAGDGAIVVAASSRREAITQRLHDHGFDTSTAIYEGRYLSIDVNDMLSAFMVDDVVDSVRFHRVAGDLLMSAVRTIATKQPRVAACGECASILWAQGNPDAAIEVERLCNQLVERYNVDILCGFPLSGFSREEDKHLFERICREV